MTTKKTSFYMCDVCKWTYADNGIAAPKNSLNIKIVCQNCFKLKFGAHTPLPAAAAPSLQNQFGAFLPPGGKIISNDGASIISTNGGSIISTNGGGIVTNASSNIISTNGGGLYKK